MNEAKRYSPRTIFYDVGSFIKNTIFLYILVYFFNKDSTSLLMFIARYAGIILPFLIIILSIAVWLTHKYSLSDTTCYVYSGIFNKKTQSIPLRKIQNMNEERNFLHKLLRVTTLNMETAASGDDATISFQVISAEEARRIKEHVLKAKNEPDLIGNTEAAQTECSQLAMEHTIENESFATDPKMIHFQPTIKDTIKASFTSFSFFLIFPIILTIYNRISDTYDFDGFISKWMDKILATPLLFALTIIVVLIIAILFGRIKTYLQYGKFEIASDEKMIYITKGILNETSFSVPKERVQAVNIEQSFIKRILGIAEVQLITAGGSMLDTDRVALNKLYPFFPKKLAYEMVHTLLPTYSIADEMKSLRKNDLFLKLLRLSWLWISFTAYLLYKRPILISIPYSWLWLILMSLAFIICSRVLQFKQSKYLFEDQLIQLQTGGFNRSLFVSKRNQVIEVQMSRSFIQKKCHVATIGITNRAQPIHVETIRDIAAEDAQQFLQWYQYRIQEVIIDEQAVYEIKNDSSLV